MVTLATGLQFLTVVLCGLLLVRCAWTDVSSRTVRNRDVAAVAALFAVFALVGGVDDRFAAHLAFGAVTLVAGYTLWRFKTIGGGDAKLLAAAALWAGPSMALALFVITAVSGGALALAWLAARTPGVLTALQAVLPFKAQRWTVAAGQAEGGLPYAVAIGAGGLWVLSRHMILGGIAS